MSAPGEALHFLGHLNAVKPRLTLAENLEFWARSSTGRRGVRRRAPALGARSASAASTTIDAGHLSQGQTRRLALARLLVSRRPIWLLDEPTAALDADGEDAGGPADPRSSRGRRHRRHRHPPRSRRSATSQTLTLGHA